MKRKLYLRSSIKCKHKNLKNYYFVSRDTLTYACVSEGKILVCRKILRTNSMDDPFLGSLNIKKKEACSKLTSLHNGSKGVFRTQSNQLSFFVKIVNVQKPSTIYTKKLYRRCMTGKFTLQSHQQRY